jgi:hypothetical protein
MSNYSKLVVLRSEAELQVTANPNNNLDNLVLGVRSELIVQTPSFEFVHIVSVNLRACINHSCQPRMP